MNLLPSYLMIKLNSNKLILFIIAASLSLSANAQKIIDIFNLLPGAAALEISVQDRKQMFKDYQAGNKTRQGDGSYRFGIVDTKSGYLNIEGGIEGKWEMCYWNLPNRNQLVAIYQEGCGPACDIELFEFYIYNGKTLVKQDFNKIIPDVEQDFFKQNPEQSKRKLEEEDQNPVLLFQLPRKGSSIIATFTDGVNENKTIDKKYLKGNQMELLWNNGKFKKGKIYWK